MSSTVAQLASPIFRPYPRAIPFHLGYSPALDGIRGLSILAVLAVHTSHVIGWAVLSGGNIGVDIFFTLSGFLITILLLQEWERTGRISLWNFYLRRVLRLIPALLIVLAVIYFFSDFFFSSVEAEQSRRAVPIAFVYMSDLTTAFLTNVHLGALQHSWSLSMEEHFYLIWPVLLVLALKLGIRKNALLIALLSIGLAVATHRFLLWQLGATPVRTYYGIDTRADALVVGCAAGIALTWNLLDYLSHLTVPAIGLLIASLLTTNYATPIMHQGGFTLVAIASAIVLINITRCPSMTSQRILEFGPLVWVGKISYGIYLWHYPVFKAVGLLLSPWFIKLPLAIGITLAASCLSYYLVEKRALSFKARFC